MFSKAMLALTISAVLASTGCGGGSGGGGGGNEGGNEEHVPEAMFVFDTNFGEAPLSVSFTNTTDDLGANFVWLFSDGGISYETNPTHTFQEPGVYSVTLIAENNSGGQSLYTVNSAVQAHTSNGFVFFGSNDQIEYLVGDNTPLEVPLFLKKASSNLTGLTSNLISSISLSLAFNPEKVIPVDFVLSDWTMAINSGQGPDLVVGGFSHGELSLGMVSSIQLGGAYWVLGDGEHQEVLYMELNISGLSGSENLDFYFRDSLNTFGSNGVVLDEDFIECEDTSFIYSMTESQ